MTAPRRRANTPGQLWWRARGIATRTRERLTQRLRSVPEMLTLDDVRRRLELMLIALHGRTIRISHAPPPERRMMDRVTQLFTPQHRRARHIAWTDGESVLLPAQSRHVRGDPAGVTQYRLLALVQAERIVRGTAAVLPSISNVVERDLFLLREALAVEARLTRDVSSMVRPLADARQAALQSRPPLSALRGAERAVEAIVRDALAPATADQHRTLADTTPADSLAWARATSQTLQGAYLGVAPVAHWGTVTPRADAATAVPEIGKADADRDGWVRFEARTVRSDGEGSESEFADPDRGGDAVEDDRGQLVQDPSAGASGDPAGTPDVERAATAETALHSDDGAPLDPGPVVTYPEWSSHEHRYRRDAVQVRERVAVEVDTTWAADTLRENAPIVRRIRERFAPLRAQRLRLNQQRDGEELDLQACIEALIDVRIGQTPRDRVYTSVRPARRAMAICLLVDVSGSTAFLLKNGQRVVDVERQAVLLASEAFDVLGDDYALLTFSSRGTRDVRLATLKDFQERNGPSVRRRIGGIEPGDNTRLGAAIRHASARLAQQPQGRRLLLILSDGRPNDFDEYYEEAGVEDSRQAINEARALGVFPFCITVDRLDGAEYLPRIFGPTGYTVLRDPEQLPLALVRVVKQLLTR